MSIGFIYNIGYTINDTEYPLRAGNALLNGVIDIGESFDRFVKH